MSLKDNWKDFGKGLGRSFAGLGKSIVKSAEAGLANATDEQELDENGNPKRVDLRETWSEVGHSFASTGKSLGKAAAGTVKKVADSVDPDEAVEAPKEENAKSDEA